MSAESPQHDVHAVDGEEPSALRNLAHRMRHIYKTRVRTTTIVLIVAFFGLWIFYSFSSQHYYPDANTPARQVEQTRQPTQTTETPTSTSTSEPSTPQTGADTTTPTERSTPPNIFDRLRPTTETTVEPTETPRDGSQR